MLTLRTYAQDSEDGKFTKEKIQQLEKIKTKVVPFKGFKIRKTYKDKKLFSNQNELHFESQTIELLEIVN